MDEQHRRVYKLVPDSVKSEENKVKLNVNLNVEHYEFIKFRKFVKSIGNETADGREWQLYFKMSSCL